MPLNLSLGREGKGRRRKLDSEEGKLSCDAVLTDVSAHCMGNYKEGMKLQRCHGLGLSPTVLISHYMGPLVGEGFLLAELFPPRGLDG